MSSTNATTPLPGILHLLMGPPGLFWLQCVPAAFVVLGDAAR
jgi:hypothetical protein